MTRSLLALALALVAGCSVDAAPNLDLATVAQEGPKAEVWEQRAGMSPIGSCDLHRRVPLTIDPSWDEETAEHIRAAARLWEDAVGVDLGDLPTSEVDCGRGVQAVPGCITLLDVHVSPADDRADSVRIYLETIIRLGGDWGHFRHVVAHEIGHYLGIEAHPEEGLMSTGTWSDSPAIDDTAILAYESACIG